jgi:hypothetical protein
MSNVAIATINTFGPSPQADFESPDDPILEIPLSELQGWLDEMLITHNQLVELIRVTGIMRGKELAKITEDHTRALKAEKTPLGKILLVNAFTRQLIAILRKALQSRSVSPSKKEGIRQAITKIQLRAECLINHIKTLAEGKEKVALSSPQARQYLAGMEGKPISRRDCIRALHRAEKICPALECGHLGDGRATTRLTAKVQELLSVSVGNGSSSAYV